VSDVGVTRGLSVVSGPTDAQPAAAMTINKRTIRFITISSS
jgi:hypothetical protein